MDARADEIIRRQERMAGDRATWEQHWREIARLVLPRQSDFNQSQTPGAKRTEFMYDATAALALERFAAAMESMLTPRTGRWHKLTTDDAALDEDPDVRAWLDAVTEALFAARYSPRANFASQAHETYMSLGAFGTGAVFVDEVMGLGLRYKSLHLSELFFAENMAGAIDTVHRRFEYTARQAAQRFKTLPERIRTAADKEPERKFEFIHCVWPRDDVKPGRRDWRGMPFASVYVAVEGRQIVDEGGYRSFPYAVSRYVTAPREIYGRSPAMTVLPDIKMVNEMSKTTIRAANMAVDPPLLLSDDGVLQAFQMRPGALNFGGVGPNGEPMVKALENRGRFDISLEMMDQRRKVVNDAFLVTLFQILVETPAMTATEAMLRAQEKGALLAPTMGRQQSEMLGPMIERELDILASAGQLPPMPDALIEAGAGVRVEYESPMVRAQRAEEGVGILRTLEGITPLAQIDPTVLDGINPDETLRALADINGAPQKVLRTREEVAAIRQQRAGQQQAAQLLEAAPVASKVASDLASIQQKAGQAAF